MGHFRDLKGQNGDIIGNKIGGGLSTKFLREKFPNKVELVLKFKDKSACSHINTKNNYVE